MNLQKNIPTLIDVIREKLTQSLPILLESVSKGNSDLSMAECLSQLSHGLKELLNQAGQEVLKAVIESLDSQEERIERNGRTYTLKDEASEKFYFTEFGRVSISRRYYHCHLGDAGIVPLDELLEMDGQYAMPDVVEKILWLSSEFVPGKIAEVLEKLLLITISPKAIQNIINQDGAGIAEMIETDAEQGELKSRQVAVPENTKVFVASLDGVNLRLREKGPDQRNAASGQKLSPNSSFKNAMVGSFSFYDVVDNMLDFNTGEGSDSPFTRLDTSYIARMPEEHFTGFKQEFKATLAVIHQKLDNDVKKIILMDGARSYWRFVDENPELFEGYHLLLDFYHACDHLYEASEAIFGKGNADGVRWAKKWKSKLKRDPGAAGALIQSMLYYADRSNGGNKALQAQITFFKNNQSLMNYHEHVTNGWPIGSGPVEAGCKTVVKARLCRSGMRWSRDGGRNILALRVLVQSGDWDHAWNHYRTIRRKTAA